MLADTDAGLAGLTSFELGDPNMMLALRLGGVELLTVVVVVVDGPAIVDPLTALAFPTSPCTHASLSLPLERVPRVTDRRLLVFGPAAPSGVYLPFIGCDDIVVVVYTTGDVIVLYRTLFDGCTGPEFPIAA